MTGQLLGVAEAVINTRGFVVPKLRACLEWFDVEDPRFKITASVNKYDNELYQYHILAATLRLDEGDVVSEITVSRNWAKDPLVGDAFARHILESYCEYYPLALGGKQTE